MFVWYTPRQPGCEVGTQFFMIFEVDDEVCEKVSFWGNLYCLIILDDGQRMIKIADIRSSMRRLTKIKCKLYQNYILNNYIDYHEKSQINLVSST